MRRAEGVLLWPALSGLEIAQPRTGRQHAIAVLVNGEKVGYVAPEISTSYYEMVNASATPITCPARRGSQMDHEQSGVEMLLDFSSVPPAPAP